MTLNKKIKIFTEKSEKIGFGHFNRSRTLFKYLMSKNLDVEFIDLTSSIESDPNYENGEIYLIDSPNYANKIIEIAYRNAIISITLDHFGKSIPDYNVVIFPHSKPKGNIATFIGFKHVIFNEKITLFNLDITTEEYTLICLGGADINQQSLEIAKKLYQSGYEVKVILGPLAIKPQKKLPFEVFYNPLNFFELIKKAKYIICNGGNTLFECLYLKKQAFIIPQSILEERIAHELYLKELVIGYSKTNFDINDFKENIHNKVSFQNNEFDNLGKERILNILEKL